MACRLTARCAPNLKTAAKGVKALGKADLRKLLITAAICIVSGLASVSASAQSLIRDAEIERTMDLMARPIFKAAGVPPDSVNMMLVASPDLNAFVFAGRNMVFFTGLLTRLKTPEAVIAVIAHETGHITGNHLARRAVNIDAMQGPALAGLLLSVLAGAATGSAEVGVAGALGSQSAAERFLLAYNRGEESSADQAAANYLEAAGIDPAGLLETLKIFKGQELFSAGRIDPYARTHPLSSERLAFLENRIANSPAKGGKASDEIAYWHARAKAKLSAFLDRPQRTLNEIEGLPETELTLMRRAVALHRFPAPDDALKAVDKLIAMRPEDPFYHELKGQILYESGRGADAVAPLRKAVSLAPDEPLIRGALGRALLALGDEASDKEALEALEAARRADLGEAFILRDLAVAYARAGREGDAALATAERFALRGDMKDALRHARIAQEKMPEGGPGWLKADDIRAAAERALKKK